ncbi:MAG: ribokinase [Bacteroidales bacterium]|nr:ribokinase [Bacteroidales bacterium]MBQ6687977.1 ribokinase [Bacteroidales bacterium]
MSNKIMVIGSSNTDMTVITDRLPVPGETVLGGRFAMGPGGKGANQAVAAQRLGGNVSFICKVGNDIFGDNAIKHYLNEGMDTSGIMRSNQPSGVALISVDKKAENCIVVASGANADITEADIEAHRKEIEEASILLLQLEIPVEAVVRAAKIGHEAGNYVILNPAPACELPEEIYQYISLIIPNQTEIALMTGVEARDEEGAANAVEVLRKKGVQDVIVTMGSKGSMVYHEGKAEFVPSKKVNAVDTTAAGDTYCGGLCVALSEGKDIIEAARFATAASALTVQKQGAQESIPYRKDIIL